MLRKLAIVFIVVFMQSAGTEMQVSCALGVLAIFFVLHINYTPFDDDLLDDMEKYSMLGSMLVYYFGLLIFSGEHLWGSAGRIAISCAILLTNCAVFGYFALTIFLEVRIVKHRPSFLLFALETALLLNTSACSALRCRYPISINACCGDLPAGHQEPGADR